METPASSRRNSEVPSFDVDGGQSGTHGTARRKKVAHRSSRNGSLESVNDDDDFLEKHGRKPRDVHDLEELKASSLRRQGSRHLSESYLLRLSMSHAQPDAPKPVTPIVPMASPVKGKVSNSKSLVVDTPVVVGKGRMSMEKLRQSYDAVVLGRGGSAIPMMSESAFPWLGRFLLCLVGHMHFAVGLPSRIFCFLSYAVLPLVATGLLAFATATTSGITSKWSFTMASTLGFFQLGVSFASFSLRRNQLDYFLGPIEKQLDDYAEERGFMKDWQRMSRRRLVEIVCVSLLIALLRGMSNFLLGDNFGGRLAADYGFDVTVLAWSFWYMIIRYLLLCYSVLHIACGFELALDSFTLRFFNELDLEEALEEWNVLQATLRQVSSKLSDCLLVIGACCLASVMILAEHVLFASDVDTDMVVNFLSRFFPLILFFLYCILRAAEVTEKANRVAPLVNSWQFQNEDTETVWMDDARQYAVQYINQSRAGFYVRGALLTVPNAQRISYYFAAISFATLSRLVG